MASSSTDIYSQVDCSLFEVKALTEKPFDTEQDAIARKCRELALELRIRPTLPPDPKDPNTSWTDTASGTNIPLYCCAFRKCTVATYVATMEDNMLQLWVSWLWSFWCACSWKGMKIGE